MYLGSSTANLPLDILDAHFLTGFVVVVVPFTFREIDGGERRVGLDAGSLEITLNMDVSSRLKVLVVRDGVNIRLP